MISKFDLAKALRDKADLVATANSYKLVANGESFEPDVDKSHTVEIVLFGDDNSVGLPNASSDISFGIYQLSVHSPKSQTKWAGLEIADVWKAAFSKGLQLTFNSQLVVINTSSLSPMMQNGTHLIHHLSITFSVIN